jgi:tape measure domain-containing protein
MSDNNQYLKAIVTADTTDYENNLKRASKVAKEEAGKMEGAFGGSGGGGFLSGALSIAAGNILTSVLTGAVDLLKKAAVAGYEWNVTMERARITFTSIDGDVGKANAEITSLRDLAKSSEFGFPIIEQAAQNMRILGFTAENTEKAIRGIGNATAVLHGGEQQFLTIADALGRMQEKSRLTTFELRSLLAQNVPIWDILAEQSGKSKAAIKKMAAEGRIDSEAAIQLIIDGMNSKFAGGTESVMKTSDVMMSKIQQNMAAKAGEVFKPFYDKVLPIPLKATMAVLGSDTVNGFINGLTSSESGAIDKGLEFAGNFINTVKGAFGSHSPSTVFIQIGQDLIAGLLIGFQQGTNQVVKTVQEMRDKVASAAGGETVEQRLAATVALRQQQNFKAFMDMTGASEGADYHTLVGGGKFDDLSSKPKYYNKQLNSTAAGKYQFNDATWNEFAKKLGLTDFSELSQDLAFIEMMRENGSAAALQSGDFQGAVTGMNRRIASFPGSPYGQSTRSMDFETKAYDKSIHGQFDGGINAANAGNQTSGLQSFMSTWHPKDQPMVTNGALHVLVMGSGDSTASTPTDTRPRTTGNVDAPALTALPALDPQGQIHDANVGMYKLLTMLPDFEQGFVKLSPPVDQFGKSLDGANVKGKKLFADTEAEIERLKITWKGTGDLFESVIGGASANIDKGFKGMMSGIVIDFAKGLADMANKALAANLRNLIFGSISDNQSGGQGWLGKLLGFGISAIGSAFGAGVSGPGANFSTEGSLITASLGGKATGGPVTAGVPYMTGERGRELFVPKTDGTIINNDQLNKMGGGKNVSVTNNFYITSPDGKIAPESQRQAAERMVLAIQRAA